MDVDPAQSGLDKEPFVAALDAPQTNQPAVPSRMLAAMVDRPEATYFLKAMGPVDAIATIEQDFDGILQSLKFGATTPIQWTLPEGWTEVEGGAAFRLATLTAPNGMTVAVTSLTPGQDLLLNINRWQGQIGLPNISEDQIDVERLQVDGQEVIFYDKAGNGTNNSMAPAAPPAIAQPSASRAATSPQGPAQPGENGRPVIPFQLPAPETGWVVVEPTGSKILRWEKETEAGTSTFEVHRFPAEPELQMMLSIWAAGIGVQPPTVDQVDGAVEKVEIAGTPSDMIQLPIESTPDATQKMVVARRVEGPDAWYFKWQGPTTDMEEMNQAIRDFLAQIQSPK